MLKKDLACDQAHLRDEPVRRIQKTPLVVAFNTYWGLGLVDTGQ